MSERSGDVSYDLFALAYGVRAASAAYTRLYEASSDFARQTQEAFINIDGRVIKVFGPINTVTTYCPNPRCYLIADHQEACVTSRLEFR